MADSAPLLDDVQLELEEVGVLEDVALVNAEEAGELWAGLLQIRTSNWRVFWLWKPVYVRISKPQLDYWPLSARAYAALRRGARPRAPPVNGRVRELRALRAVRELPTPSRKRGAAIELTFRDGTKPVLLRGETPQASVEASRALRALLNESARVSAN